MCGRVVEHRLVDDVGESSLQRTHGFHRGLAVGSTAVEVGASLGRVGLPDSVAKRRAPQVVRPTEAPSGELFAAR